jgi:hypothetical protein
MEKKYNQDKGYEQKVISLERSMSRAEIDHFLIPTMQHSLKSIIFVPYYFNT